MQKTSIGWTDFTSNPIKFRDSAGRVVWGCVKVSAGCANCYAETLALRWRKGGPFTRQTMDGLAPFLCEDEIYDMRNCKQASGHASFVGDMTDLFGEWVTDDMLNRLFSAVFELRTDVTWQLLTKRADRMRQYLSWRWGDGRIPARNIHVGVSAENQAAADERIPLLLTTPAAVRWVSFEPLLGQIDAGLTEYEQDDEFEAPYCGLTSTGQLLSWAVIGGESGPGRRDCDAAWIVDLAEQCKAAGVPTYIKQDSGPRPGQQGRIPLEVWQRKEMPV